jgi:hypothetical protein
MGIVLMNRKIRIANGLKGRETFLRAWNEDKGKTLLPIPKRLAIGAGKGERLIVRKGQS